MRRHAMLTVLALCALTLGACWLKLEGWPIPSGSKVSVACKGYFMAAGPWKIGS